MYFLKTPLHVLVFLIFSRKQELTNIQIVSIGDSWHEMSNPVFWEKYFKMSSVIFSQHSKCYDILMFIIDDVAENT